MSIEQRLRFYDRAGRLTPFVGVDAGGAVYLVRTQDQNVGRLLFAKQSRGEMRLLPRAVALIVETAGAAAVEGSQFLDVGANIGTTTVPALTRHPFATALCFEPEPENILNLRLNLLLNGLEDRATAVEAAVSDRTGTSQLVSNPAQSGQHWIAIDSAKLERLGEGDTVSDVPTVTLDALAGEGVVDADRVGLLWIDAQGHEGHVLAGAGALTERGVPIVLEWDPRGLDRLGDRRLVEEVVAQHYTHFVDLRSQLFELRRADALGEYAQPFLREGGRRFTDILVLRLTREAAKNLDVRQTLERHDALSEPPAGAARGAAALLRAAKRALRRRR